MKAKSKKVYYNLYYNDIPVLLDDSNCILRYLCGI